MELSKTQFKVSAFIGSGYDVKEIADKMCRSYHTIASHVKSIRKNNNLKNLAEITREFTLEFGDPRQYIAMVFLMVQLGIIYENCVDLRRVKGKEKTSKIAKNKVRARRARTRRYEG